MTTILNWATSAQGLTSPANSTSDGTYLYVILPNDAKISRILISNPSTYTYPFITITSGGAIGTSYGITYSGGYIYTAQTNDTISKWNATTGALVNVNWGSLGVSNNQIVYLANDGTYLYALAGSNIYRLNLSNGAKNPSSVWFSGASTRAIAYSNGYIYTSTTGTNLVRIRTSDASSTILYSNANFRAQHGFASDGNYLYNTYEGGNALDRYDLSSNTMTFNWITGLNSPFGVSISYPAISYGTVYGFICNTNGNSVSRFVSGELPYPCFKRDTKILTNHGYVPVQNLRKGHLVKTLNDGYVPIYMVGKSVMNHNAEKSRTKHKLYKCTKSAYPELTEDLVMTGCHSVLVEDFKNEEERQATIDVNGNIYITDSMYRLPVCIDKRAVVYETPGEYTIYHLALENEDYYMNYGIYANGLLVESCSKRFLKELSKMKIISK